MPGGLTLLESLPADIPTPAAGKVTIFFNTTTGLPSYKDDTGTVFTLTGATGATGAQGPIGQSVLVEDGLPGEDGFVVPAQQLNNSYRIVRKTADESVTSSVTLQNDNELLFSAGINEVWLVVVYLFYDGIAGASTGGIRLNLSVPAGATGTHGAERLAGSATEPGNISTTAGTLAAGDRTAATRGVGSTSCLIYHAVVVMSTTAGNINLSWAQNVSNGTATSVLTNSVLQAWKIG